MPKSNRWPPLHSSGCCSRRSLQEKRSAHPWLSRQQEEPEKLSEGHMRITDFRDIWGSMGNNNKTSARKDLKTFLSVVVWPVRLLSTPPILGSKVFSMAGYISSHRNPLVQLASESRKAPKSPFSLRGIIVIRYRNALQKNVLLNYFYSTILTF